jgi:hypothetical protein
VTDDRDFLFQTGRMPVQAGSGCIFRGRQVFMRLGAFEFFRRMAEVESYTYADFPRGDVSGVVTETGRSHALEAGFGATGIEGWAGFGQESRAREIRAEPSVINFASGQSRLGLESAGEAAIAGELFDFGWSVVKAGAKEPMMVSQLVLVSVPAYLDEIEMSIWKGFLDVDRVPTDRTAPLQALDGKSFDDATLEERLGYLMEGLDRREITIRVPPDYAALDSIVIGRSAILGPVINTQKMNATCRPFIIKRTTDGIDSYHFDLLIPGERLWRSSVVTLGGMKATAIEVMPNMRGLRASFETPVEPVGAYDLRVWTSEGASDPTPVSFASCDPYRPVGFLSP